MIPTHSADVNWIGITIRCSERMAAMVSRARFTVAVVWAISLMAAIGRVVLLAMSWNRALTDDVFAGFGGISFATMSVAFATAGRL